MSLNNVNFDKFDFDTIRNNLKSVEEDYNRLKCNKKFMKKLQKYQSDNNKCLSYNTYIDDRNFQNLNNEKKIIIDRETTISFNTKESGMNVC